MRELDKEFKELRLYGMAGAWEDLVKQGGHATLESSRWLLEHLLQAEVTDRAMRSVSYQMHTAKFPVHRDLAGFDFECSPVDKKLIEQLASMAFTEQAHNVVLSGWPRHGQDASGHGHRRGGHHAPWLTRAVLLHGGSGQRTGAGEGPRQGRPHRSELAAHGPGHP
jgi:hypothetical protein